ncbi:uncharacterized protein K452DRAFT_224050, partial [Aplosporella prunicola CBS 121167]
MLGQLLHSFNPARRGSARQPSTLIESVTEDSHTRNLLFPEANQLFHADSAAQAFGGSAAYDGAQAGIDLEQARDFRVIIAQDEVGPTPRTVLFDSKPDPGSSLTAERRGSRGLFNTVQTPAYTPGHGRRSSLAPQGSEPRSPTVSAFQRARTRGASISAMSNIDEASHARSKESEELIRTCLDCMFGNTAMSYRGPSNKLHIIPLDQRQADRTVASPAPSEATNSFGRKRSGLATSYTPSNIPAEASHAANGLPEYQSKEARRRTILITRTFSVQPPDEVEMPDSAGLKTPTPGSSLGKGSQFPFPQVNTQGQYSSHRGSKQRRTPMYAITIILHLPVASAAPAPVSRSGIGSQKPGTKTQGGQDSLGSSFDSERRAGWTYVDSAFGVESLLSTASNSDVDDRVDVVGQHWDVITRTLTSLQFIVQDKIMNMFRAADLATPALQPLPTQNRAQDPRATRRESPMSVSMPPRRVLKLHQHALLFDADIKNAAEMAGERVVRGMKVPRVVTGQARWGVWREEARWLSRWAGGREQNFFLFNLLTAFLGTHTEWLNVLGPKNYRAKHREQQKANVGEDLTISSRTVIVSADKMAARRLVFLLSTFLPASTHTAYDGASPVRPSTSNSVRGYSQSPPSNATISRQQSLRRTINRRGHKSYPNMSALNVGKGTNRSSEAIDTSEEKSEDGRSETYSRSHSRRPSQVHSIKSINATGLTIPSMADDSKVRKNSITTTSTVTPETAVPVAHFAVQRVSPSPGIPSEARPSSSGSLASVNLRQNLQRTGSTSTDSQASRWGSFMSFWSGGRRESSADTSGILQSTDDGLSAAPGYRRPTNHQSPTKLQQMVDEMQIHDSPDMEVEDVDDYETATQSGEQSTAGGEVGHTAARAIPARQKPGGPLDSPLKLSVNETDGVIDVDISLPGFGGGSPLQSPLLPTLGNSVSSLEGAGSFGPSCHSSHHSLDSLSGLGSAPQTPVNVAGWLARFHQDFELQGVSPYPDLEKDVRRAMSAEPTPVMAVSTPTLESGPTEKWVSVCTALIADARTFTVKRINLKRLVRLIPSLGQPAVTPGPNSLGSHGASALTPGFGLSGRSQYGNPYNVGSAGSLAPALPMTELHLDERFIEEPVMDLDETLVEALEKAL